MRNVPPSSKEKSSDTQALATGGFAGGQVGTAWAEGQAAATDAVREGMEKFLKAAQQGTPKDKLKGFLFEHIMATKFNQNAARAGKNVRAIVTGSTKGGGHDAADIRLIGARGERLAQAKVSDNPTWLARKATDPKYDGMDVVTLEDQAEAVNRKLAQRGETRKVVTKVQADRVSSGSTTTEELARATENPKLYRLGMEARQVSVEALDAGAKGAIGGLVVGGALSAIGNVGAYLSGKVDARTAGRKTAKDAATSGARGAATSALGAVIRRGGSRIPTLTKSNVATAVASGVIEVGVSVFAFAKGEITAEEAAERIGETGCATASGIYVGAAAGAVFGPPGAIVGSVVGYMAMSWVYQSSLAILRQAQLAEEEASRAIALCAEATRAMDQQRKAFEARLETWLARRDDAFQACLKCIDDALLEDEVDDAVEGLARLAGMTGKALRFEDFEEFDEFMIQAKDPLVI